MNGSWHFPKFMPGHQVDDPLQGEHFGQHEAGDTKWNPASSLVRECIQNSLDARAEDQVSVRFVVSSKSLPPERAHRWFASLWPHIRAERCKIRDMVKRDVEPCHFVTIEDFGTRGLEGDISADWPPDGQDNHFFYFIRAEGLSGRNKERGGSWGAGKSVFARSSRIHTYMALSVRRNTQEMVLTGKSVLWHHEVQGERFTPFGLFGVLSGTKGLIMPCTDAAVAEEFSKDFLATRGKSVEPGLTVVVPFADPDITADKILEVAIREYFYPVLAGKLIVSVSEPGLNGAVLLDQDTIIERAKERGESPVRLLNLAKWSLSDDAKNAVVLPDPPADGAPKWDDNLLKPAEAAIKEAGERFARGEPVAIRVPVRVYPKEPRTSECSEFDLFLQKDKEGEGARPVFVRGDIVVPHAKQKIDGVLAIAVIRQGPLFDFLRLAEPPAHEKWVPDTGNIRGRYQYIKQTIDFVGGAPRFLAETLAAARTQRDEYVLAEFFPDPDEDGEPDEEGEEGAGGKRSKKGGPANGIKRRPQPFKIERIDGGFRVVRDNAGTTPLPGSITVRAAYDTSIGNPFKKWEEADFHFNEMQCRAEQADPEVLAGNVLSITPRGDDFMVEVTGFDPERELKVECRTVAEAGEDEP